MIRKLDKKGAMDISFGWIFAILVGGVILSLAIFGVVKFSGIQRFQQSAETSTTLDALINPLESGYETGQKVTISANAETRIYTQCDLQGALGRQRIQTSQKSFNEWSEIGPTIVSRNKYIFSENPTEGKDFVLFTKPFEFPAEESYEYPFKVADLIFLISQDKKYCFDNPPESIEEEISNLNIDNFIIGECPSESIRICFSKSNNCDMIVNYNQKTVDKNSERLYFETDALMYAAILSDKEEYECQLKRIIRRSEQLSIIYQEKSRIEKTQGCEGNIESELIVFTNLLNSFGSSEDLNVIITEAKRLNKLNAQEGECKLW
jgi:hypothetical protein